MRRFFALALALALTAPAWAQVAELQAAYDRLCTGPNPASAAVCDAMRADLNKASATPVASSQPGHLGVTTEADEKMDPLRVFVVSAAPGGPAEIAGLRRKDQIIRFDGRPLQSADDLSRLVAAKGPGSSVPIEVVRDGQPLTLQAVLSAHPVEVLNVKGSASPADPKGNRGIRYDQHFAELEAGVTYRVSISSDTENDFFLDVTIPPARANSLSIATGGTIAVWTFLVRPTVKGRYGFFVYATEGKGDYALRLERLVGGPAQRPDSWGVLRLLEGKTYCVPPDEGDSDCWSFKWRSVDSQMEVRRTGDDGRFWAEYVLGADSGRIKGVSGRTTNSLVAPFKDSGVGPIIGPDVVTFFSNDGYDNYQRVIESLRLSLGENQLYLGSWGKTHTGARYVPLSPVEAEAYWRDWNAARQGLSS